MTITRRLSPQHVVIIEACEDLLKTGPRRSFASLRDSRRISSCNSSVCSTGTSSVCSTSTTASTPSRRSLRRSIKKTNRSNNNTNKKSVRFSLSDEQYKIGCAGRNSWLTTSPYELCDETIQELWWTREELKKSSSERKVLMGEFVSENYDKDDKFLDLYKSCASSRATTNQVLTYKMNQKLLSDLNSFEIRGLEGFVCRARTSRRKQHLVSTLLGIEQVDKTFQFIPEKHLLRSSRTSQLLAQVFAHMDAVQAGSGTQ